jgi:hypothetical protein
MGVLMSEMPSVTVDTPESLYGLLKPKEKELDEAHIRPITAWLIVMTAYMDPNACSCRKTQKARESLILQMCRLPDNLSNEHKETIRNITGTSISLLIEGQRTAMIA